jgi:hypothetical protein
MRRPEIEPPVHNISTHPSLEPRVPRIAIVGAGFVGSTTAFALMMSGMAAEIVLIDRDSRRAEGHVNDLRDAEVFSHTTRIFVGDFSDCCSADVTIVTAGVSQSGQKSRMEGLRDTGAILHGLVNDVCLQNPLLGLRSLKLKILACRICHRGKAKSPSRRLIGFEHRVNV